MTAVPLDRPTGPQAPPTRAAASLVRARRAARGARPWTAGTIAYRRRHNHQRHT